MINEKDYYIYHSPGGGTYRVPIKPDTGKLDKYWKDMEERTKQRRDWEDRGEPVGW